MNSRILPFRTAIRIALGLILFWGGLALAASDWLTVNQDLSAQRYVENLGLSRDNLRGLRVLCEARLNEPAWFGSGLVKVDDTLYVTTLRATYALSARDCRPRWRAPVSFNNPALPNYFATRGVTFQGGRLYRGTADGQLLALDAQTGALIWSKSIANPENGEYVIAAPIAWSGLIFTGIASSDLGIRGRVLALDTVTGETRWVFQSMEMGNELGGGFWTSFSLDETTETLYAPVTNPSPVFYPPARPGPNRHTNSVVALNARTGALKWSYQPLPADEHDWDLSATPTLYRTVENTFRLAVTGKSGVVYGLDPRQPENAFKTPGTTLYHTNIPLTEAWLRVCPGAGAQYNGTARHPGLGLLFVGMIDWCRYFMSSPPTSSSDHAGGKTTPDYQSQPYGRLTALDERTGAIRWQWPAPAPLVAGLVTTEQGLLLAGDVKGRFTVHDAQNGTVLKTIELEAALNHGLIAYPLDGQPRIAVATGGTSMTTAGVAGPLAVKLLGMDPGETVTRHQFPRLLPEDPDGEAGKALFLSVCSNCHGKSATGGLYPSLMRNGDLSSPKHLADFLATVPPPMPRLYPGLLDKKDVSLIAQYLRTTVFDCRSTPQNCEKPGQPKSQGTRAWRSVYSVMTSPRCLNCHTATDPSDPANNDYPRQTDLRRPHLYGISRGSDDHGLGNGRCDTCHGRYNNPITGAPGVGQQGQKQWQLAPTTMAWESRPGQPMTGSALCQMIKDPNLNGGLDGPGLLKHIETEPLVLWAWNPGIDSRGNPRSRPPLSHQAFVAAFGKWLAEGAPCPGGPSE